jgi:mRNA-degrading endonuclease RelE of RelBE toxin-antitoxin system
MYNLNIANSVEKDLKKITHSEQVKIISEIENLPFNLSYKKMQKNTGN